MTGRGRCGSSRRRVRRYECRPDLNDPTVARPPLEMTRALAAAVARALDEDAGAIVLAAEPPVFCAGGSLDDLLTPRAPLPESYVGMLALANAPVVTIAAVGGAAIGAGVNLPLACDVVIASPPPLRPSWLDVSSSRRRAPLRLERLSGRQAALAPSSVRISLVDGLEPTHSGGAGRRRRETEADLLPKSPPGSAGLAAPSSCPADQGVWLAGPRSTSPTFAALMRGL